MQIGRDHGRYARRRGLCVLRRGGAVLAALALVLIPVLGGCGAKRVTAPPVASAPGTVKKRLTPVTPPRPSHAPTPGESTPATAVPEPRIKSRTGTPGYRTTPESVNLGLQAAALAREQMGKQYQWGATGPDRFDCSGLTYYVFGQLGVQLPRVSRVQATVGKSIGRSELQPGDLVFFCTSGARINHVGIYLGQGEFVHAPRRHMPVRIDSLKDAWWRRRFRLARRLP